MKSFLCFLWVCLVACGVRADWRSLLQTEGSLREKEKIIYFTVDRARELEKAATPEDAPYLHLYLTLLLAEGINDFEYDYLLEAPDETVSSRFWKRLQVEHLIQARLKQDLDFLATNPSLSWDAFSVFRKTDLPRWPNQSILFLIPELPGFKHHRMNGMRDERFDQMLAIANASGDLVLEGYMALKALDYYSEEGPEREALIALRNAKPWPDALIALLLAEEAKTYTADHELQQKAELLQQIVDRSNDYNTKVRAQTDLNALRLSEFDLSDRPRLLPPTATTLTIRYRNMNRIALEIHKDGISTEPPLIRKDFSLPPPSHPYAWATTELELPELPLGEYALRWFSVGNLQGRPFLYTTSLKVSNVTLAFVDHEQNGFLYVADAATQEPLANTDVTVNDVTLTTDANGFIPRQNLPETQPRESLTFTIRGETFTLQHYQLEPCYVIRPSEPETHVAIITDRPGHRAGDTLRWKAIVSCFDSEKGVFIPKPHEEGRLVITDQEPWRNATSTTFFDERVTTDETGCFIGEITLPKDADRQVLYFQWDNSNSVRCHFTEASDWAPESSFVEFALLPNSAPLPSERQIQIRVRDISGLPLAGAPVHWKSDCDDLVTEGDVTLDENGTAIVTQAVTLPKSGDSTQGFFFRATVKHPNGEETSHWEVFYVQSCGYRLTCSPAEPLWCFDNCPFNLLIASDERAELCGEIEVYPLAADATPRADFVPTTPPTYTFPFTKTGTLPITLPAGLYLLRAKTAEMATAFTLVRVLPTNAPAAASAMSSDKDGILRFQWPEKEESYAMQGCVILSEYDKIHYEPVLAGTTLKGFAALKGHAPTFITISSNQGIQVPQRLTSTFFELPIPQDAHGRLDVFLFTFDRGRWYKLVQTIEVKPPQTLHLEANHIANTVAPNTEATWSLTVNDPTANVAIVCYNAAWETDVEQDLRRFDFGAFVTPSRYTFPEFGTRSPYEISDSTIGIAEYAPFDICNPNLYALAQERNRDEVFNPEFWGHTPYDEEPFTQWSIGHRYKMKGPSLRGHVLRRSPKPPTRNFPAAPASVKALSALAQSDHKTHNTILWLPKAPLDNGEIRFTLPIPDTITSWRLVAYAITPDGRTATFTHLFNSLPPEE